MVKKKTLLLSIFFFLLFSSAHSQLMVTKLVGKNFTQSKLGFGLFGYYEFPFKNTQNNSIRIELFDFGYFPTKSDTLSIPIGYISIKIGYKHIFSETKTGFYFEPQAGYCRVVSNDPNNLTTQSSYGDGFALALEFGYSLEVGERGHVINIGLKYENDIAGSPNSMSSLGFRVSYAFNLFGRRDTY